jgi:hypothetical protein
MQQTQQLITPRPRKSPARRSASAIERDAAYRRRLDFEIRVMAGQRKGIAKGFVVRPLRLDSYPASLELVRAIAFRLSQKRTHAEKARMRYRGFTCEVSVSSLGRCFVSTVRGEPIGVSNFGAVWAEVT